MDRASPNQLASRNIKTLKPRRRPLTSTTPAAQSMSFGGGGFGSQSTGSGGFNFSAGGPAVSFPPTNSFPTIPSPELSQPELHGHRPDPTGEEAKRKSKGFRAAASGDSEPLFASLPKDPIFSFVPSQPPQNSTPNPFNTFGVSQPASQPATSSLFGASAAEKNTGSMFNFGASQPAATSTAPVNFFGSSASQAPAASTPFAFGQQASAPANPFDFSASAKPVFGSTAPAQKPLFGGFGGSGPAQSANAATDSTNSSSETKPFLFASTNDPPAPSIATPPTIQSNPFSFLAAPPTTSTMFGSTPAVTAPSTTPSLFGNSSAAAPSSSTNNLFGGLNQSSTPSTAKPFGGASQSNGLFNKPDENKSQNLFKSTDTSTPPSSIFGSLSKPSTDTSVPAANTPSGSLFSSISQPSSSNSTTASGTPSGSLFGRVTQPSTDLTNSTAQNSSDNPFNRVTKPSTESTETPTNPPFKALFGADNPQPTPQQPLPSSNLFGSSSKSAAASVDLFSNLNKPVAQPVAQTQVNGVFGNGVKNGQTGNISNDTPTNMFGVSSSTQDKAPTESTSNGTPSLFKPSGIFGNSTQPSTNKTLGSFQNNGSSEDDKNDYSELYKASALNDDELYDKVPAKFSQEQRELFYKTFRIRSLNNALAHFLEGVAPMKDVTGALTYYNQLRSTINLGKFEPSRSGLNGAAKPNGTQNTNNPPPMQARAESRSPLKAVANTSQAQSVVNGNAPSNPTSTSLFAPKAKSAESQKSINGSTTPKAAPPSFPPPAAPAQSLSPLKNKRRAEEEITKDTYDAGGGVLKKMKTPATNGGSAGSTTSNIFKSIIETPSKQRPTATPSSLRAGDDEKPRQNPFAALKVPGSAPAKTSSQQSTSSDTPKFNPFANLPRPEASATTAPSSSFTPKPTGMMPSALSSTKSTDESSTKSASSNLFAPKQTDTSKELFPSKPAEATKTPSTKPAVPTSGLKMPTFGAPTNFLAQFTQNAAKSQEDFENELFESYKAKEYDSEDSDAEDIETFKANWKAKREAEKKEIAEIQQKKQVTFDPKKGFADGAIAEKSTPSPSNSIFGSANVSRTSTPSIFQAAGGLTVKPGQAAPSNIFGHLTPSAQDSGNEAGDEDGDDDSGDENDVDAENKDPSYQPGASESSSGSPATPVEATGFGIASAKKPSGLFDKTSGSTPSMFGKSGTSSGASTPSLFDRITKDANGAPMRQLPSSDEKENTMPTTTTSSFGTSVFANAANPFGGPAKSSSVFGSTTSPFGNAGKTSNGPADQTWKPETPIKFASSTQAPSVSLTAATPNKPASPFANLFGNSIAPKPLSAAQTVGFSFGGLSAASSLMPSADTSRASTPGITTDGESEADPDAEKHEQINLTAGGPGEEDEDVLYEVRAKALLFSKDEENSSNPWLTKGVGPFRILKNKNTEAVRLLLRQDPSGAVVINHSIPPQTFKPSAKTVKMMLVGTEGLQTWILQVKTVESAQALAEALEANKPADS